MVWTGQFNLLKMNKKTQTVSVLLIEDPEKSSKLQSMFEGTALENVTIATCVSMANADTVSDAINAADLVIINTDTHDARSLAREALGEGKALLITSGKDAPLMEESGVTIGFYPESMRDTKLFRYTATKLLKAVLENRHQETRGATAHAAPQAATAHPKPAPATTAPIGAVIAADAAQKEKPQTGLRIQVTA